MTGIQGPDSAKRERLTVLIRQYEKDILRICYLYLRETELAKDAVQDTFLKVYKNMETFRYESSEKTWIMKIAINTCCNINRSGWFRFINHKVTPEMMPDKEVQTNENDEELTTAVTKLPIKLREVILLYYYQGLNVNEIADALGISQSSVSGRLKRGREKLKCILEGRELDE